MARIDSSTRKTTPAPVKTATPPKAKAPAPKPTESWVKKAVDEFSKTTQKAIESFGKSKNATTTTNRDGSTTRSRETERGNTKTATELTTKKGPLLESGVKYEKTTTKGKTETKDSFSVQADILGRKTTTQGTEVSKTRGDTTKTASRSTTKDEFAFGVTNTKTTTGNSTKVADGKKSTTSSTTVTKDARGNKLTVEENSTAVKSGKDDKTTTTKGTKTTSGSELNFTSGTKLEDGKFSYNRNADWKNGKAAEASWNKEKELKPADKGFTQVKDDKLSKAQKAGDVLAEAGLKHDFINEKVDTLHKAPIEQFKEGETGNKTYVGADAGIRKETQLSIGSNGITGNYKREAVAGVYAQSAGKTSGKYGEAQYTAEAKAEAKASVTAKGKLDTNGLDLTVGARASASVEASVTGKATTKSVNVGGVPMNAGVEGSAKVSAEVAAEATGRVKVTRNPPTAIAEGTVGVSAVAKAEAEVKASAGPFSVKASVYASAGAEAKATGIIGYENGKLKIGGSAGAALGVGAGGAVAVEVDVKMIGDVAKNTAVAAGKAAHDAADVNNDGKLGLDDVGAAASKAKNAVSNTVSGAASKVKGWFGW